MKGRIIGVVALLLIFLTSIGIAFPTSLNAIGLGPKDGGEPFKLGLDLQGGVHLVYEADMTEIPQGDRVSALEGVRDVIERRVNAYGVSEPVVQTNISGGHYRVIIELAGIFDVNEAISLIGETPILEFKVPVDIVEAELTDEQQIEIDEAQEIERSNALDALDRALDGESFDDLVGELSIDESTNSNNGYIGYIDENHSIFDGLAERITDDRLKTGVIDGLYESTSAMHIVNFLSEREREEVELSHILICYDGASRCSETRNKVEAEVIARDLQQDATTRNFATLAEENSDGPSATNGGSLGIVKSGEMVSAFEDAYKALDDGDISSIVETEFGYHIIYRQDTIIIPEYEIAHIEMPWTTSSDILQVDPWENTDLSGKQIRNASVGFDQLTGAPYVILDFDSEGGQLFEEITESHVGNVIGIFLDGQAISTPVVQQAIYGGSATITGQFTLEDARLLAQRLNAGALPVPIDLLSEQTVGPTLGQESLQRSIQAAIIGLILVALFMTAYYRLAGFLAVLALMLYTGVNLALYKLLGVTISLAGIAGFVLSIGMAVDANVLIFERLKEELRSGRDLRTAIDEGFRRAWTSIRDGNFTTLIAAVVLFTMSTSFIKGFALTLSIGIIVSMLTAILGTRVLLQFTSSLKPFKKNWLYGVKKK